VLHLPRVSLIGCGRKARRFGIGALGVYIDQGGAAAKAKAGALWPGPKCRENLSGGKVAFDHLAGNPFNMLVW
jgi:hypothetical protein